MEQKIKAVQYGVGKMSLYTMRYMIEKGIEIVGAVDVNPAVIGKDIGEILGKGNLGVIVVSADKAEEMMKETKPDICVITTRSLIAELEEPYMLCAKLGINAISTCEEAFYPQNSNPTLTEKIDMRHRFKVLRFVGKTAADRGHLAGFRVHGRQVDIVGVIFQAGRPGFRFRTLAAGQQILIVGTVGAGVGRADGEVAAAEIIA